MDADGSHQPEKLRLLAALPDADLRWAPGGCRAARWSTASPAALSQSGNVYVRKALGLGVHDAIGGYRAFRRSTLEARPGGVASQLLPGRPGLADRAAGLRVTEVPIEFVERCAATPR
jgi:dolichol-phosphate mannosyltransferase